MVPLPSAEPLGVNAVETIARLTLSQTHKDHPNDTHTQSIYSKSTNNNTNNSPQNNTVHPHNQSTVILQQFSMITQELRNLMEKGPVTLPKLYRNVLQLKKYWQINRKCNITGFN